MRTLVWYRGKDLRISDHVPLRDAAATGEVIPLFVLDPYFFAPARAAELPHRVQFLLASLRALEANLADRGSRLLVVAGKSVDVVPRLARRWRVDRVVAHRWVEPFARERDARVCAALDVPLELHEGETLHPPGTLRNRSGQPFQVYTHFARAFLAEATIGPPVPAPRRLPPVPADVTAETSAVPSCEDLGIAPNPRLLEGGEAAARERLRRFLRGPAPAYDALRDRMDREGTSRLSADLKFGTISPRTVWHEVAAAFGEREAGRKFERELIWREFTYSTLWDRPELLEQPARPEFAGFPWRRDRAGWRAWAEGRTGYPIIDASARQLLGEGFVHNRARMASASFLTKHLGIHYRLGEAHYMKYLSDGDWAQNNFGWQWSAGCGYDAQPFFRVFNPVTQGEKFDPDGGYVRRWLPELAALPDRYLHRPWTAPAAVLRDAGVRLGTDYPAPIVELAEGRARFLAAAAQHLPGARAARPARRRKKA